MSGAQALDKTPSGLSERSSKEVLLEGDAWRSWFAADDVLFKRHLLLFKHGTIGEYRGNSNTPWQTSPLHPDCEISTVTKRSFRLKPAHANLLLTVARKTYENRELPAFTLTWPQQYMVVQNRAVFAFETFDEAEKWRQAIAQLIPHCTRWQGNTPFRSNLPLSQDRFVHRKPRAVLPPSMPPGRDFGADVVDDRVTREAVASGVEEEAAEEFYDSIEDEDVDSDVFVPERWQPVWHADGISLYSERVISGKGGAFLLSTIVRAAPMDVARALLAMRGDKSNMLAFSDVHVLESAPRSLTFSARLKPAGWMGALACERALVLQRTWSESDDGVIKIQFRSVDHESMPDVEHPWWSLASPIVCKVGLASFVIAPLAATPDAQSSQESMLELLLDMDLGGMFGPRTFPLYDVLWRAGFGSMWLSKLFDSIAHIRDAVEQARFVVQPFAASQQQYDRDNAAARDDDVAIDAHVGIAAVKTGDRSVLESAAAAAVKEEGVAKESLTGVPMMFWSCPGAAKFKVRGANYLEDRKKVAAGPPVFKTAALELITNDAAINNIAPYLPAVTRSKAELMVVVNLIVPRRVPLQLVVVFESPSLLDDASSVRSSGTNGDMEAAESPFDILLSKFLAAEGEEGDRERNGMFKLIPTIVEGSWLVRQSVGSTPVLIGNKLKTSYFTGPNYLEISVDIGSDRFAAYVVDLVIGAVTSIVVDLAFVLQGQSVVELPERLLGTVRLNKLDLSTARHLKPSAEDVEQVNAGMWRAPKSPPAV